MKKLIIFIVLLLIPILTFADNGYRITPGWQDGEIFINAPYYYDMNTDTWYRAIYRSMDNGATLTQEHVYATGENSIGPEIVSDATPGVLYAYIGYPSGKLHRSDNYGLAWEYIYIGGNTASYFAGTEEGVIFMERVEDYGLVYLSTDYGEQFECINDSILCCIDVGNQSGELYGVSGFWGSSEFKTHHSIDYGASFTVQTILPDSLAGDAIPGNYPKLYKGTEPGEAYLVSWHFLPPDEVCPKLFISSDSARTFEYKYTLPYYELDENWYIFYNSGSTPGSFYFLIYRMYPPMVYSDTEIQIAYSNDYGETFTFYTHHFGLNVGVDEDISSAKECILLQNYPNPFSSSTMISFSATDLHRLSQIKIYNIKGELVKKIKMQKAKGKIEWNGTDDKDNYLSNGIYLYKLKVGNKSITKKMVLMR